MLGVYLKKNNKMYSKEDLKPGDIITISGYYFDWTVKYGYSIVLDEKGIYATAQGGLIHSNLEDSTILTINGIKQYKKC